MDGSGARQQAEKERQEQNKEKTKPVRAVPTLDRRAS